MYHVGEMVIIGSLTGKVETILLDHDGIIGNTAYSVRMSRDALHEGLQDIEVFDESLLSPVLVTCPTCLANVRGKELYTVLSPENQGRDVSTCVCCNKMYNGFLFAKAQNTFYAVKGEWFQGSKRPAHCVVFYRIGYTNEPIAGTRKSGYGFAIYQEDTYPKCTAYVAFTETLNSLFQKLDATGYGLTLWENLSRDTFHHQFTTKDIWELWRVREYGVIREVGTFDPLPEINIVDLEDHPF